MIQGITQEEALADLLNAIEEDRLAILCGAGLSMAPPSNVPSAAALAEKIFNHCKAVGENVANDLEAQANHFLNAGRFPTYFLEQLIPRNSFSRPHNPGHSAIADFLLCKAISTAISTNVDVLIEGAGRDLSGEITGFLDGREAENGPGDRSPLLKIHGCWAKAKNETIWAPVQLEKEPIKSRIEKSRNWLDLHLSNKDILVVGFWSDWSYLNTVLDAALGSVHPAKVTIVDLSETAVLETKAPGLWALGNQDGVSFRHIQSSGADFLDSLRTRFSRTFYRKAVLNARQAYEDTTGSELDGSWCELPDAISSSGAYAIRRDIEGREPDECARLKSPDPQENFVGLTILQLCAKGAILTDGYWLLDNKKIRVLKTARLLHAVKEIYRQEVPPFDGADFVICVGSEEIGVPANIARAESSSGIVRGGPQGKWLTRTKACEELNL